MIFSTDVNGIIRAFNPAAEQLLGWRADELVGKQTPAIWHVALELASRAAELSRELGRTVQPGHDFFRTSSLERNGQPSEWTLVRKDGTTIRVQLTVSALCDSEGRVSGYVGTAQDLTEREQAEEQLAAIQVRFETLAGVSLVAIMFFDSLGNCIGVNDRWCEMSGISREVAHGDGWHLAVHPDDRSRVSHEWNQATHERETFHSEYRFLRSDGEILWLAGQGVPIRDSQGAVSGFIGVSTDVTNQKQIEEALRVLSVDLAAFSGSSYYETVARHLSRLLNCEIVAVCGRDPQRPDRFLTAAYLEDSQIRPNFSYASLGTPCADVIDQRCCLIPQAVQQQYPDDAFLIDKDVEAYAGVLLVGSSGQPLGHLVAMSRRPFAKPDSVENALKLFSTAVASELERETSERRFSDLFEFAPDAVVITNRNGIIMQANRQVATVFGWTPAELLGQPVEVLMPADLRAGHPRLRERYLESALPRAMGNGRTDLLGLRKDGNVFPVDISLSPMQAPEGLLVVAAVRDVTERKGAEKAMVDLQAALDQVAIVAITDSRGKITFVNDKFCAISQYSREELIGQDHRIINSGHHPKAYIRDLWETITSGRVWKGEFKNRAKDGTFYWVDTTIGPYLHTDGEPSQYIAIRIEITERKRVEEQLAQALEVAESASRAKSEFLASMSHELRTPLNGILGMNELLLHTELTERQRQFVDAGSTSGKALLQQINDILDLSKIEAGKLELDLHECRLETLVFDIVDVFVHSVQQKGYPLHCHFDPAACVKVLCDGSRIQQILVNLLGNALKFTTAGAVTLRADCTRWLDDQLTVRFSVTDTGVGIPEDRRDRLFMPFSQVDSSTSRKFGGTGLGLSICKQLVELMGGQIGVESQLGVGSTFWFELAVPVVAEDSAVGKRRHMVLGQRVLVVDRDDSDQRQVVECLQVWGCRSEQVATMQNALEEVARAEAASTPFAAVVADCQLVVGDEYVLLQKLSKQPRLPIIGLGTNPDDETIAYLYQLGVRHVLRTPVRPSTLFNALTSVMAITSPNQPADAATDEPPTTFSGHILVAEDNSINQMFVRELLKHCDCTCDIANNGDEALVAMQQKRYDLALMDCQMPEMDGFTATREIRRREATGELTGHLPIIALTANALKGDRERCLEAGMDDYLSKPLQAAQLQTMLAKHLAARSAKPTQ